MRGSVRFMRYPLLAVVALITTVLVPMPAQAAAPPAPAVGSCHTYGWTTYLGNSDTSVPVPCTGPHVARTLFVGRLWTNEPYSTLLNDQKMAGYVYNQCLVPTQQAIGPWKTVATAGFTGAAFLPTQAEYTAGARWFRCDVILPGAGHLYAIPNRNPEGVPLSPGQARCLHMTSQGALAVACAAPHTYRAAGVVLAPGTAYPSRATWLAIGQNHCPPIVRSSNWYLTWAGPSAWAHGNHYLTCYRPTTL